MAQNKSLSTQEVAQILHVSKSTIYELIRRDISILNRRPGSSARVLLDGQLHRMGLDKRMVAGSPGTTTAIWASSWRRYKRCWK